jgi:hypothetical protein
MRRTASHAWRPGPDPTLRAAGPHPSVSIPSIRGAGRPRKVPDILTHPLRSAALLAALLVAGAAALPSGALAQQGAGAELCDTLSAPAAATRPVPATAAGPARSATANPLTMGLGIASVDLVRWAPASPVIAFPPQDRVRAGPNIAMMAVGGAALVTGLIIGGDGGHIIAAGGVVVGLIGLYRYLR